MMEVSFMALATKAELSKALTFYTVSAIIVSVVAAILGAACGIKILRIRSAISAIESSEKKVLADRVDSTESANTALKTETAQARLDLERLREKQRPRVVSAEQRAKFLEVIHTHPNVQKLPV